MPRRVKVKLGRKSLGGIPAAIEDKHEDVKVIWDKTAKTINSGTSPATKKAFGIPTVPDLKGPKRRTPGR